MPEYEYKCEKCHAIYLNIESIADHLAKQQKHETIACPKCGSMQVRQLISDNQSESVPGTNEKSES